jgi:hypothetical protein
VPCTVNTTSSKADLNNDGRVTRSEKAAFSKTKLASPKPDPKKKTKGGVCPAKMLLEEEDSSEEVLISSQ